MLRRLPCKPPSPLVHCAELHAVPVGLLEVVAEDLVDLPKRSRDRHGADERRDQDELKILDLLRPVTGVTRKLCGSLELLDRVRSVASPEPEHAGDAQSPRQTGVVVDLCEDADRGVELGSHLCVAALRIGVQPEVRERDGGIGGRPVLAGRLACLHRLRKHSLRPLPIARLGQGSTERGQQPQPLRIVGREQRGRALEKAGSRRHVTAHEGPSA